MSISDQAPPRERGRERRRHQAEQAVRPNVVPPGLPGGQYRPLTDAQVRQIVDAALTVLEETGIEVMPSACREVWRQAGARIDAERNRVFIPRALISQGLASAAHEVRLCGQLPEHDLLLGGTRVYMGTGGAAVKLLDLDGHVRATRLQDLFDIGRMVTALENIHFYLRPVVARDIPVEALDINTVYASLAATPKHVMCNSFSVPTVRATVRLAGLIAGGEEALRERPFISWTNCWTVSPLRYAPETVETLDEIVRQGMPVAISSAPQAGATSPVTLAGTLVQLTAEQLSGITYINLLRPGHPVLAGYVPSVADLRTGSFSGGSPEFALMNAAAAQLAQHLGLPLYNSSSLTDSKVPDIQSGYEKGLSAATAALAGANYIHHSAGFLESMLTVAYEQYVIDDDINGSVMRLVRGIEVTDATLAVDVIHDVCTGEGHFLGHPQTLSLMNSGYYYPHTADRNTRDRWEEAGALDMRERAKQRARELLRTAWPTHLAAEVDARLRAEFDILLPREVMRPKGAGSGRA
ncbi:MAG: trimethylamine methyltransferase family protein [Anaerolineales bacterium]|nr:trimethylamine methyltransferase family protein [Anaerolineales bacterium]